MAHGCVGLSETASLTSSDVKLKKILFFLEYNVLVVKLFKIADY